MGPLPGPLAHSALPIHPSQRGINQSPAKASWAHRPLLQSLPLPPDFPRNWVKGCRNEACILASGPSRARDPGI